MKLQKLTAGLLALSMVGAPLPAAAPMLTVCAADETPTEGTCGENLTWTLDENGLLTIDTAELLHGPLDEAEYAIFDISEEQSAEPVAKGKLEDVTKQKELTDEPLVLDLTSLALKPGEYRIEMETGTAEFTVSR